MYNVHVITDDKNRIIGCVPNFGGSGNIPGVIIGQTEYGDARDFIQKGIIDNRLIPLYKLEGGKIVERTSEEVEGDYLERESLPNIETRIKLIEGLLQKINDVLEKLHII